MKRVALHTLGCKLNFAETASLGKQFAGRGFTLVSSDEPADVFVLNTCTVTERADRECRQLIRRALRHSPDAYVIVAGCYAQLRPDVLSAVDGVDLVLGTREKFDLFTYAGEFRRGGQARVHVGTLQESDEMDPADSAGFGDRTRGFLKIQDGCDYSCSFCTIPRARGKSRSLRPEQILLQARALAAEGFREIVLTGVNVGDYGRKAQSSLLQLLRAMVCIEGIDRIRISSIEPNLLDDELMAFWLGEEKLCKHFHIPLQSGSDRVLWRMRRRYHRAWYADRVDSIKKRAPMAGIGADVIVGFPGETEEQFKETYGFLANMPVSYVHVFPYSERPNTPAASYGEAVEPRIRADRSERLRSLGARKRRQFHESHLGRTVGVLFEGDRVPGVATGLTGEYVRVDVPTSREVTNLIQRVRITGYSNTSCSGELVA